MDLFLFGTLLHLPLLEQVSGDVDVGQKIAPATRAGYRVSRVEGHVFPMMHPSPDSTAHGVIVTGLDAQALARLDYYEKAFGYDRVAFTVLDANEDPREVTAYVPEAGRWSAAEPWDFEAWAEKFGPVTTLTAQEALADMEGTSAAEMGAKYPQIMTRAASRLRAQQVPPRAGLNRTDVSLIGARKAHDGFFTVEALDLTFKQFDGAISAPINREVFVGVDCAIVLPYDPVRDRVLLVEQFRPGAYVRGDANPWTVEPVAGRIDPGETPEDAARREAFEEAGVRLQDLHLVSEVYPSPGTTSEYFFIYVGLCDLPDDTEGVGGLVSEAEDIRSQVLDWATFDRSLTAGDVRLLPLLAAGHWLARNRDRLRAAA